jgi:hypothetical protein
MQSKPVWVLGRCAADTLFFIYCAAKTAARDYCMLRKYKNGQRETVCIKKIIQKSSIFLTRGCPQTGDQKASEYLLWNGLFYFK